MIRTSAVAVALTLSCGWALAQSAPAKASTPSAKPAAAAKPAPKRTVKQTAKRAAPAAAAAATAAAVLPDATPEQLTAAERAYYGNYECEFNQKIDVGMNPKTPGYVDVVHGKRTYTMKPVLSSTGALRLEDVTGRTMLLQIANKSMLMDKQEGRRIVDACKHEKQRGIEEIKLN